MTTRSTHNRMNKNNPETKTETTMNESDFIIRPTAPARQTETVMNGGARRGARENLSAFAAFNRDSTRFAIVPTYVDPVPGRAEAMKKEAAKHGVEAEAVEGKIEEVLAREPQGSNAPLILNVDRCLTIASVLKATENTSRTTLIYLLLKLPSGALWAIRAVLLPHETEAREKAIAFFERLAQVSERNASGAILGDRADPAHLLLEPAIRAWFGAHTQANLAKITAGIEPESEAFEVTSDGANTLPLVLTTASTWSDPRALAEQVVAHPSAPLRRGTSFVIGEVTGEGVRFHQARRRTDDRTTVGGSDVIDAQSIESRQRADDAIRDEARAEQERREAAATLARASRETLSLRNPVTTTD